MASLNANIYKYVTSSTEVEYATHHKVQAVKRIHEEIVLLEERWHNFNSDPTRLGKNSFFQI